MLFVTAQLAAAAPARVTVLQSGPDGIDLTFELDRIEVREQVVQDHHFSHFTFEDAVYPTKPGQPQIPSRQVQIAIPPNVSVSATWDIRKFRTEAALPPVPTPEIRYDEQGTAYSEWRIPPSYLAQSKASAPVVRVSEPEMFRFMRYVTVDIFPIQIQAGGDVQFLQEIDISINWQSIAQPLATRPAPPDPLAENLYRSLVINPEEASQWRFIPNQTQFESDVIFEKSTNWVKLKIADEYDDDNHRYVDKNGVYRITGQDLQAVGVANLSNIDLSTVRLFTFGGRELPRAIDPELPTYREVPIQLSQPAGGMEETDTITFYGMAQTGFYNEFEPGSGRDFYENPYAAANYYWLTWGGNFPASPLRIETLSAVNFPNPTEPDYFMDTLHMEKNYDWLSLEGTIFRDDSWGWEFLVGRGNDSYEYSFDLPDKSPFSDVARVEIALQRKVTSGEIRYYLNDMLMGVYDLPNSNYAFPHLDTLTGSWTIEGENRLRLDLLGASGMDPDQLYMGWFSVEYARQLRARDERLKVRSLRQNGGAAYTIDNFEGDAVQVWDVTDHFVPARIPITETADGTITFQDSTFSEQQRIYYAFSEDGCRPPDAIEPVSFDGPLLHQTSQSADYLMIAPRHFHDTLQPLRAHRQDFLYATFDSVVAPLPNADIQIIDSEQIYAEFSGGYLDPAGIRNFLRYTLENWSRPPLYVLFVSDANRDYRNYREESDPVINYIPTFQWPRNPYRATDDWLVWLNEGQRPDMINGRFPTENESEVQIMVDKVLAYETEPVWGAWRNRVIAVADDYWQPSGPRPGDSDFTETEDIINRSYIPLNLDKTEIFLIEYPYDPDGVSKTAAHDDLIEAVNAGAIMVRYTGHGGPPKMAVKTCLTLSTFRACKMAHGRPSGGHFRAMWPTMTIISANVSPKIWCFFRTTGQSLFWAVFVRPAARPTSHSRSN